MIYLSTAASAILEAARTELDAASFGSRFQALVVEALKAHPRLHDLYDNRGAGQPDCYANTERYGFEMKAWSTDSITLDDNSRAALAKYTHRRLVATVTTVAPYPIWVAVLGERIDGPIKLARDTPADSELETHLKSVLSPLVEAIGVRGITEGNLDAVATRAAAAIHQLRTSV
jgi:hypothetical protein